MKRSEEDIEFGKRLQQALPKDAGENVWFTPRVLNRLPQKEEKNYGFALMLCYVAAALVCLGAIVILLMNQKFAEITMRDVYTYGSLFVVLVATSAGAVKEALFES